MRQGRGHLLVCAVLAALLSVSCRQGGTESPLPGAPTSTGTATTVTAAIDDLVRELLAEASAGEQRVIRAEADAALAGDVQASPEGGE